MQAHLRMTAQASGHGRQKLSLAAVLVADGVRPVEGFRQHLILGALLGLLPCQCGGRLGCLGALLGDFQAPFLTDLVTFPIGQGVIGMGLGLLQQQGDLGFSASVRSFISSFFMAHSCGR